MMMCHLSRSHSAFWKNPYRRRDVTGDEKDAWKEDVEHAVGYDRFRRLARSEKSVIKLTAVLVRQPIRESDNILSNFDVLREYWRNAV